MYTYVQTMYVLQIGNFLNSLTTYTMHMNQGRRNGEFFWCKFFEPPRERGFPEILGADAGPTAVSAYDSFILIKNFELYLNHVVYLPFEKQRDSVDFPDQITSPRTWQ